MVEFTPLEPVGEDGAPVEVEVTRVLFSVDNEYTNASVTISNTALQEGDRITVCQCFGTTRYPRRFPLCHRPPAAQWRGFVKPLHTDERRAGMVILKEKILTREQSRPLVTPGGCHGDRGMLTYQVIVRQKEKRESLGYLRGKFLTRKDRQCKFVGWPFSFFCMTKT